MLSECHRRCLRHPCHCHRRSQHRSRHRRHRRRCQQRRGGIVAEPGVVVTERGIIALRCRVSATSLVLSPKGVVLSASVASLPSVELLPSLVLVSSSPSVCQAAWHRRQDWRCHPSVPMLSLSVRQAAWRCRRGAWRCRPSVALSSSLLPLTTGRQQNDVSWVLDLGVGVTQRENNLLGGDDEWSGVLSMAGKA